ncbi:MAG: DEAD/DEAH box helicase [Thermomicrobiales bacterium]|nr:DEAD/DEAH box helicase [Thermomicrobiales bacterium]
MTQFFSRGIRPMYHWNTEGGSAVIDREIDEEHEIAPVRVDETHSSNEEVETTFADLGLSPVLLESITQLGFKKPTPIQEAAIPALLNGQDIIGQAQTGSGKTAAFGLPIIDMIDGRDRRIQALILTPTRELAIQVSDALHNYGKHKGIQTLAIYGGQAYERQFRGLERGVHIVVGTPGRVMDHMRRNTLKLDDLRFFVLDEADEMLDMGFVDDIETILSQVPAERQTALFSATMPQRIADLANTYLRNPQRISVRGKQMTVAEINQTSYEFPRGKKVEALTRILEAENPTSAMIFCRTKRNVDELGEALLQRGLPVETLHGDLSQVQRDRVMRRFRNGQAQILIATDVAARGLDIPEVSHVINYDVPESHETYVHRIGRTGRAGRTGEAITLVSPREFRWLRQVERTTRATIEPRRLPSQEDVNARRREKLVTLMREAVEDESNYQAYIAPIADLPEDVDLTKLAAALLKLYAEETGQAALDTSGYDDLANFGGKPQRERRPERGDRPYGEAPRANGGGGGRGHSDEAGMTRLFINIGHNMRVRPQDFVGAIANEANIPGRTIGAIDIHDTFSFVDVPSGDAERVMNVLNSASIKGRPVNVEMAQGGAGDRGGYQRAPRRDDYRRPAGRPSSFGQGPRRDGDRRPRRDRW